MHSEDPLPGAPRGNISETQRRMQAFFGGAEGMYEFLNESRRAFGRVWEKDSKEIGEVLHAHLVVEHFLDAYIRSVHPTVDFDVVNPRYDGKLKFIPQSNQLLIEAKPALSALGVIRNRFAHRLERTISKADVQPMLKVSAYLDLKADPVGGEMLDFKTATARTIYLDFAQWIAGTLQLLADPRNEKMRLVFDLSRNIDGTPAPPRSKEGGFGSTGTKRPLFGDS